MDTLSSEIRLKWEKNELAGASDLHLRTKYASIVDLIDSDKEAVRGVVKKIGGVRLVQDRLSNWYSIHSETIKPS